MTAERPAGRAAIAAWCLYDWANSAFPTVVVTFVFANYFERALSASPEQATEQWGLAISASAFAVALLSPVFGAIADKTGRRKPWLALFTGICILTGAGLWTVEPSIDFALRALVIVAVANATFEIGQVFYNAMLPEIAPESMIGRVSGWAWGLGYFGGLASLALCLVLLIWPDPPLFGLDPGLAEPVRATALLVSVWFLVFSLPVFVLTPDRPASGQPLAKAVREGFAELAGTLRGLKRYSNIAWFLLGRMLYIDGLNTLFVFGGIYAAARFGMDTEEVLIFAILLNVTAGLGAVAFGWLDDLIGAKRTIIIAILGLIVFGAAVLLVEGKTWFYLLGAALGVFVGPAQSASRSLMGRLAPEHLRTEMFGLYAFSGKATAFLGPLLVGLLTAASGSMRIGMTTILVLLLIGLLILLRVREPQGQVTE